MPLTGPYEPSPETWVREQVEVYERTGGARGNTQRGVPIIVVTSRGVKSGALRKNPVMRVEHDGCYAVVASKGGAPQHPSWYYNILAEPLVDVQDGPAPREMRARLVGGDELAQWWARAVAVWPDYASYQQKTDRRIPVFVLEPVQD